MRRGGAPYSRDGGGGPRDGGNFRPTRGNDGGGGYGPMRSERGRGSSDVRPTKERPGRTLFVRNIHYEVSETTIKEMFDKYGEIKRLFNLVSKRGMAFVTFYDTRAADKAKRELQGLEINGRTIDVHFALPKDGEGGESAPGEPADEKNTGTLFVTFRNVSAIPPNPELKSFFEKWGEVREVRDCRNSPNQKFVEYFDLRDCESAFNANHNAEYLEGTLDIKYAYLQGKREGPPPGRSQGPVRGGGPMSGPPLSPRDDYRGGGRNLLPPRDYGGSRGSYDQYQPVSSYSPQPNYYGAPPASNLGYNAPLSNAPLPSFPSLQSQLQNAPLNFNTSSGYSGPATSYGGYNQPLSQVPQMYTTHQPPDPHKVVLETMSQYTQSLAQSGSGGQSTYQPSTQSTSYQYAQPQSTGLSSLSYQGSAAPAITSATAPQSQAQLQQLVNILLQQQQQGGSQQYTYPNSGLR